MNDNERNKVIREAIASYESDPPDTRYQLGYLDALLDIAERECGIDAADPLMRMARKISDDAHNPPEPPPRAKLILIDGGRESDNGYD